MCIDLTILCTSFPAKFTKLPGRYCTKSNIKYFHILLLVIKE